LLGKVLAVGLLAGFYLWLYYHTPASHSAPPQTITLPPGAGLQQIAAQLAEAGLIRHRWMFVLYVKVLQPGPPLQAGEYALRATMSPVQIVQILRSGKVVHHTLTVPAGATVRDIVTLVAAKGLGERQELLELASDKSFLTSLRFAPPSLEGYLFPDTYHVPRSIRARDLLTLMVRTFRNNYTADIATGAQRLGLTQHEVLTLASLIEKEAQLDEERPLIAAVYLNRLRRGMRLQCDATVIYALGERFDGNLRKSDLDVDSPYNTYRHVGLPPGPIASPGRRSIEAAVTPAPVDYLYFVATKQHGKHQFSRTLTEHNQAVWKYQRRSEHTP
jgi:UPF0755 protein